MSELSNCIKKHTSKSRETIPLNHIIVLNILNAQAGRETAVKTLIKKDFNLFIKEH
jgi:hypothetical protein